MLSCTAVLPSLQRIYIYTVNVCFFCSFLTRPWCAAGVEFPSVLENGHELTEHLVLLIAITLSHATYARSFRVGVKTNVQKQLAHKQEKHVV